MALVARAVPWAAAVAGFAALVHFGPTGTSGRDAARWLLALAAGAFGYLIFDEFSVPMRVYSSLLRMPLAFVNRAPSRVRAAFGASDDPIVATTVAFFLHDRRARVNAARVQHLSVAIAARLGVHDDDLERLRWAAVVHDIGKLEVPRRVLNSAGKPSKKDLAVMRDHARRGDHYVASFGPWLGEWVHAVDQHHERYDGAGYPGGLAGGDIGLGARIVAVADAVEAMTAARPYKRPMSVSAARREVERCAGAQFDPAVAAVFLDIPINEVRSTIGLMGWLAEFPLVGAVQKLGPSVNQLGNNVASGARLAAGAAAVTIGGTAVSAMVAAPALASGSAPTTITSVMSTSTVVSATQFATLTTDLPAVTTTPPVVTTTAPPVLTTAPVVNTPAPPPVAPSTPKPPPTAAPTTTPIDIGSGVSIEKPAP
jgi:hypothetical protein